MTVDSKSANQDSYELLRGGIQLNLIAVIDFTESNLDLNDPNFLHYFTPNGDSINPYEKCVAAVGEILCPYNSDQLFTVLGFGATIGGELSYCLPLTFGPEAMNVHGLTGIQEVYRRALSTLLFSGPTYFTSLIRFASEKAVSFFRGNRTSTILLILMDGDIHDMNKT
jgi:hypothetical protein